MCKEDCFLSQCLTGFRVVRHQGNLSQNYYLFQEISTPLNIKPNSFRKIFIQYVGIMFNGLISEEEKGQLQAPAQPEVRGRERYIDFVKHLNNFNEWLRVWEMNVSVNYP